MGRTDDDISKGPLTVDERVKLRRGIRTVERLIWLGRQTRIWIGFGVAAPATIVGLAHSWQWFADKFLKLWLLGLGVR